MTVLQLKCPIMSPDVVVIVALIERINDKDAYEDMAADFSLSLDGGRRTSLLPLITKRLSRNITALCKSIAYELVERGYCARQLHRNTSYKLACMTHISTAAREEEAGSEALLFQVFAGDSARNRRLSCAGQAVQPERGSVHLLSINPMVYVLQKINARFWEAGGSCCFASELKGASLATGKRSRRPS